MSENRERLQRIVERKRAEVAHAKGAMDFRELEALVAQAEPPRNFFAAVAQHPSTLHTSVIAEVVRKNAAGEWLRPGFDRLAPQHSAPPASPDQGDPRPFDPAFLARRYTENGASAISCVTDPTRGGHLSFLEIVREATPLPVLRRDIIVDSWQLWESRAAGADGVLLIADALREGELVDFLILAQQLRLTTVLEVRSMDGLLRVRPHVGFPHRAYALLAINTRPEDSENGAPPPKPGKTPAPGSGDVNETLRLIDLVDDLGVLVNEGGVHGTRELQRLRTAGVRAVLVGEEVAGQPDPGAALAELLGRPVR